MAYVINYVYNQYIKIILSNIVEKFNSGKQNNENDNNYTHENRSYLLFNDNYYQK